MGGIFKKTLDCIKNWFYRVIIPSPARGGATPELALHLSAMAPVRPAAGRADAPVGFATADGRDRWSAGSNLASSRMSHPQGSLGFENDVWGPIPFKTTFSLTVKQ